MMASEPKTQRTKASVSAFLNSVEHEQRRADAKAVSTLMQEISGEKPAMWGTGIVGFGAYQSSTGPWPLIAFAPRKANLVLYVMPDFAGRDALVKKLGKVKTGKACLYVNKLADLDQGVLRELVARAVAQMRKAYPPAP